MVGTNSSPRATSLERMMPARSRVVTKDEELGKRDDDFRPHVNRSTGWSFLPWRWRRRRLVLIIILVVGIYMFTQNIPADFGPIEEQLDETLQNLDERLHRPFRSERTLIAAKPNPTPIPTEEPAGAPPREPSAQLDEKARQYYDGPIRFYKLGDSLHAIVHTMGTRQQNHNVLFAASSLKSLANLVPMACTMAKHDRNYVHFVLFGRSTLSLEDILEANGINLDECTVFFHDARGDYPEYSSDYRAEFAVAGGMKHIYEYMHPQALIMDDSANENLWFTRAVRRKAKEMHRPLIALPARRYEDSLWITSLDAGSLDHFYTPKIEIIIQAPSGGSGSMIRLLRSLINADYSGLAVPKLTIELPPTTDQATLSFIADLEWPPNQDDTPVQTDLLTVRHRIASSRITPEQASLRFLESFYPSKPHDSYVLVLSPQAELSPLYLKYLYYMILEYRYPTYGYAGAEGILGISLDVPSFHLNGEDKFVPPTAADLGSRSSSPFSSLNDNATLPFLYQAPSSTASLIFGEKWVTLHDFLAKRLEATHRGLAHQSKKIVSEAEPAWIEYLLELMRARSWTMIYPASSFVTVHNDLAQLPEEYTRPSTDASETTADLASHADENGFLVASSVPILVQHDESTGNPDIRPLHQLLSLEGEPPGLRDMPYLSHDVKLLKSKEVETRRERYTSVFRTEVGGCNATEAGRSRVVERLQADDLFCLPGMELRYEDDDSAEPEKAAEVAKALVDSTPKSMDEVAAEASADTAAEGVDSHKDSPAVETRDEDDGDDVHKDE